MWVLKVTSGSRPGRWARSGRASKQKYRTRLFRLDKVLAWTSENEPRRSRRRAQHGDELIVRSAVDATATECFDFDVAWTVRYNGPCRCLKVQLERDTIWRYPVAVATSFEQFPVSCGTGQAHHSRRRVRADHSTESRPLRPFPQSVQDVLLQLE